MHEPSAPISESVDARADAAGAAVEIRLVKDGSQVEQLLGFYNRLRPRGAISSAEYRLYTTMGNSRYRDWVQLVHGEIVGRAAIQTDPFDKERGDAWVTLTLSEQLTDPRPLLQLVLDTAVEWDQKRVLLGSDEDHQRELAIGAALGMTEFGRNRMLQLDLARTPTPAPGEPPHGLRLATLAERDDLWRAAFEVTSKGLADIPGAEDMPTPTYEGWLQLTRDNPTSRADTRFMLLDPEDQIAAYASMSPQQARPSVLDHGLTAVVPAWRGRGLARYLKLVMIDWARNNGFAFLQTENEDRNAPMRHINESLGYEPLPDHVMLRAPLDDVRTRLPQLEGI